MQDMNRTFTTTCLALLASGVAAAPASAGGLLPIGSPAFGTFCGNKGTSQTSGATSHATGAASANFAGLPISNPTNQCGGADDPAQSLQLLLTERGF
ncbi:hypothetical protein ACFY3O_20510 [Streptomyces sp. NPDC001046]|uniref:hypothetical protein n=1 Tax=unclassified Streptomyces TaxID=2593676 RepID=UPI00367EAFF1